MISSAVLGCPLPTCCDGSLKTHTKRLMARMLDSVVHSPAGAYPPPSRPDALAKAALSVGTRGGEYEGRREDALVETTLRAEKEGRLLHLPTLRGWSTLIFAENGDGQSDHPHSPSLSGYQSRYAL